jgi:elongator complex protein 4
VWLNGQRFISSGHKQLDELLGGGLLVGSMTLLESDLYSDYADTLLAYSIAEALSNSQDAVLVVESRRAADVLLGSLPYNLTLADELQHSDDHPITSPSTESEADGLRIAWQYDKYSTKGELYIV